MCRATASPTRSRRCAASWRRRWALSCRRCASWTICSWAPTSTASASRNSIPARASCSPARFLIMDPKGLPIDLPGTHTTEPAFGLPATWVVRQPARGSHLPRLHRGGSRHGADHAPDRSAQEPHGGAALLCRDQEAAGRSAAGEQEAGGRTDPVADFRHRRAARAADPAVASASRSATCRPSWKASPKRSATPRTRSISPSMCARAWPASSATPICRRAAICRWSRCRPHWEQAFAESIVGQGEERQLAMAPSQLQQFIQQVREALRRGQRQERSAGAADQPADPALCALHHRALPPRRRW